MLIKNPIIKRIIHEVVSREESVDLQGKPTPRTSFDKDTFKDCRSLLKKIENDFDCDCEKVEGELITHKTIKLKDFKPEDNGAIKTQRYSTDETDFTEAELKAFQKYYKTYKEVPSLAMALSDEDLDFFFSIVNKKYSE